MICTGTEISETRALLHKICQYLTSSSITLTSVAGAKISC